MYDLTMGIVRVYAQGAFGCTGVAAASTHDVFHFIGPASTSAVAFHARAHVEIYAGGYCVKGMATIREGTSNSASASEHVLSDYITDLDVPVSRLPGATFDLSLEGYAEAANGYGGCGSDARTYMTLMFPDLPPGYSVESCQGFISGQIVAGGRTTWGQIKSLYR